MACAYHIYIYIYIYIYYHQPLCNLTSDKERESSQSMYSTFNAIICSSSKFDVNLQFLFFKNPLNLLHQFPVFLSKQIFSIFCNSCDCKWHFLHDQKIPCSSEIKPMSYYAVDKVVLCCSAAESVLESFGKALRNPKPKCGTSGFTWKKSSLLQSEIPSFILWQNEPKSGSTKTLLCFSYRVTFSIQYAFYWCQYQLLLSAV